MGPSDARQSAAVDGDALAADVRRRLGSHEDRQVGELFGLRQAALGDHPEPHGLNFVGGLAETIGGGLPVGGIGGKRELMQLFSPDREQPVMHASTFSGNALTMAAGLAAMSAFDQAEAERLNTLGERLREGFDQAFSQAGIKARMLGSGSLSNIHFADYSAHDAREALAGMAGAGHIGSLLHLGMLRHGVMSATRSPLR